MAFMQKNVNIFILLLVLVVAGALAGSSVYYQKTFDKLTDQYDVSQANLSECSTDLSNFRSQLQNVQASLNTTTQDIRRYDVLYSNKSAELETTQSSLEETESSLQKTKIDLQESDALKNKYKKDYESQLVINDDLEEQNTLLTAQKNQLEDQVLDYKGDIDSMESCIDNFLSDYDAGLTSGMKEDLDDCK